MAKARLREHFDTSVAPTLLKEFNYGNVMAVPRIEKVTINMGMGEATSNQKIIDVAVQELTTIAGQKPVITKSRTYSTFGSVSYRQSRRATLSFTARYDDRNTNLPAFDYRSTQVGVTAEFGF